MPVTLVQSQGCVLKMSATAYPLGGTVVAASSVISSVTSISAPANESMDIDVTTFDTNGVREYIKSKVREGGEVTVGLLFDVDGGGNVSLIDSALGDATNEVREFSIDDGAASPTLMITFQGYIKSFKGPNLEKDGVATAELVIKLSGGTITLL